jgi:hypothetical protein
MAFWDPRPVDGWPVTGDPLDGVHMGASGSSVPRRIHHIKGVGWVQGPHQLRRFKPHYAWVWPKDGKNGSRLGRLKDIITQRGPDMFVVASGRKGDALSDRPTRSRWSRWTNLSYEETRPDEALGEPFWVKSQRQNHPERLYDYRTRKYKLPKWNSWTDARYRRSPNARDRLPYALRDVDGQWIQWYAHDDIF